MDCVLRGGPIATVTQWPAVIHEPLFRLLCYYITYVYSTDKRVVLGKRSALKTHLGSVFYVSVQLSIDIMCRLDLLIYRMQGLAGFTT